MIDPLDARTVLQGIQAADAFAGEPPHWAAAMAAMPNGELPFLDASQLPARRQAAGLTADHDQPLVEMAATIAADPALRCFAWYLHWYVFVTAQKERLWGTPTLTARLGRQEGLFYLLLALEFPPRLAAWHRQLGYPPAVTAATLRQLASFEQNHLRGRGTQGIYERQFPWLSAYLKQPYVRLGRLEFMLTKHYGVNAWKNTRDGRVLALADDGCRVADDGLCLPNETSEQIGWTAHQTASPAAVAGFPIDPAGRILRRQVRLDRADWHPCLAKDRPVLDLHIPAGGGMNWAAVLDSFAQAIDFFPRHHPDQAFTAVVVKTWFMDPRLADLLPAEANPLRLQRAAYLYPFPPDPGGLWFVFLQDTAKPASLPQDTSLRRRLAAFLAAGNTWNGGGMFILREHLPNPPDGLYRNHAGA